MGCSEYSCTSKYQLTSIDLAVHFDVFRVGAKVTCSATGDRAKKFATRHVEGGNFHVISAKAGDMFDGTVRWIEDIANEERPFPKLVLELEDGNFLTCLVEKSSDDKKGSVLGWAMIISPLELTKPHVNPWMQTWQSPVTVEDTTLESAQR